MENINLNQSQCIKEVYKLTHIDVYNVCTDKVTSLPYGIDFWIMCLLMGGLLVSFWNLIKR